MEWGWFALTFIFVYVTCKMLYFLNAARTSMRIVKVSQLIGLSVLARSMENFHYAQTYQVEQMRNSGETTHNIKACCHRFNEELSYYKKKAIGELIYSHSDFFKQLVEFGDWESAMLYLNEICFI